jgi:hypothetical protein
MHGAMRMREALQRASSPSNEKQPRCGEALNASASDEHEGKTRVGGCGMSIEKSMVGI